MLIRTLTLAGALAGGAGLSQFPEFSQQYLQRLAGTVDALSEEVAAFDRAADQAGLTRAQALAEYQGSVFLDQRGADARLLLDRSARLSADLEVLRAAGLIERLVHAPRLTDPELAEATMDDFRPALPLTLEGLVCALLGALAGSSLIGGLAALLRWPFRRRASARV